MDILVSLAFNSSLMNCVFAYLAQNCPCKSSRRRKTHGNGQQSPRTRCRVHSSAQLPAQWPCQIPQPPSKRTWPALRDGRDLFSHVQERNHTNISMLNTSYGLRNGNKTCYQLIFHKEVESFRVFAKNLNGFFHHLSQRWVH